MTHFKSIVCNLNQSINRALPDGFQENRRIEVDIIEAIIVDILLNCGENRREMTLITLIQIELQAIDDGDEMAIAEKQKKEDT